MWKLNSSSRRAAARPRPKSIRRRIRSCSSQRKGSLLLFRSESLHRIEARGTPGGDDAGDDCDAKQSDGHRGEDYGVDGLGLVEHGLYEVDGCGASWKSKHKADERGTKAVHQDFLEDLSALRSESDSNPDLGVALGNHVGENAEEPNGCQQQRQRGKCGDKRGVGAAVERVAAND